MKAILVSLFISALIPPLAYSQARMLEKKVLSPGLMQQRVKFRVISEAVDTAARVANDRNATSQPLDTSTRVVALGAFRLQPGERKAVAVTGAAITKLDRSVRTRLNETNINSGVFMLPELYYAKVKGTDEQISYRILFIDSAPLRYDFEKELFAGSIRFLPVEVSDSGKTQAVQKPLSIPEDIIISYGAASVPLSITRINWPPMDITVTAADPRDSMEVKILTVSNPLGYLKNLPVEPAIFLSSARGTIQGFGIQTLPIHVALKGVSSYKPVPVTVETSLGTIDFGNITLSGDQPREVILRSESLGSINLRIVNENYRSNSITIEAVFPWLFLILAIAGGLVGGLGRSLTVKENVTFRTLALGSIIGLIAAVAYWGLGIVLIGFSIQTRGLNEAMVFGLGLIAGYFGLMGLKK